MSQPAILDQLQDAVNNQQDALERYLKTHSPTYLERFLFWGKMSLYWADQLLQVHDQA